MSDVDAVTGLLERWRDASGMQRVRIGLDATRTIGALPAARKRALAVEVARRVAPQLVPAIESEDGDLTSEQVTAVIDLLRRADRDQLDDLVGALRGGDVLGALELVDEAVGIVVPDDDVTDGLLADLATPDTEGAPADPAQPATVDAPAAPAAPAAPDAPDPAPAQPDEDDLAAIRAEVEAAARASADRWRDTTRDVPARPAYRAPALDFGDDAPDGPSVPATTAAPAHPTRPAPPATPTAARTTAPDTRGGDATPPTGPATDVVTAIGATPDGYRRRRAAQAAIRGGLLARAALPAVVASFARATDRSWVAATALDAALIDADDLPSLALPPGAAARLARRAG